MAGASVWRLELLESGAPSTMMAVPRLFMLTAELLALPPTRMVRACALLSVGLCADTPGSRVITSLRELVDMWSMAWREIMDEVEAPASLRVAVTTTSSMWKDMSSMAKSKLYFSPALASNSRCCAILP